MCRCWLFKMSWWWRAFILMSPNVKKQDSSQTAFSLMFQWFLFKLTCSINIYCTKWNVHIKHKTTLYEEQDDKKNLWLLIAWPSLMSRQLNAHMQTADMNRLRKWIATSWEKGLNLKSFSFNSTSLAAKDDTSLLNK